jgi:ankyrin repeat protein
MIQRSNFVLGTLALGCSFFMSGSDEHLQSRDTTNPLFQAIGSCNVDEVATLLNNGADANGEYDGESALTYSIVANCKDAMGLLIQHNAHVDQQDSEGNTPLMIAVDYERFVLVMQLVVQGKANLWLKNNAGEDALGLALQKNNPTMAYFLAAEMKLQNPAMTQEIDARFQQHTDNSWKALVGIGVGVGGFIALAVGIPTLLCVLHKRSQGPNIQA